MRLLIAIDSVKPKLVGDRALRWCGRLGFDMRIFVPRNKRSKYVDVIADTNYNYYLALHYEQIVTRLTPEEYARKYGYDLLLLVPEELWAWRKGGQFKANEIKVAYEAIAGGRGEFSKKPKKRIKRYGNGAVMRRLT